jgi:hypothetical protein
VLVRTDWQQASIGLPDVEVYLWERIAIDREFYRSLLAEKNITECLRRSHTLRHWVQELARWRLLGRVLGQHRRGDVPLRGLQMRALHYSQGHAGGTQQGEERGKDAHYCLELILGVKVNK